MVSGYTHTMSRGPYGTYSIIFSFWKTTLDIIAGMFNANSLPYYRIHGSLSAGKRSKILTEFEHSMATRMLLITLGTGAVGYDSSSTCGNDHSQGRQLIISQLEQAQSGQHRPHNRATIQSFSGKPSDWTDLAARPGEVSHDHSVHHER
jgi:hypothetical protein